MFSCSYIYVFFVEKGANVHYLLGADGNPWTWVLGESEIGAFESEKEKSLPFFTYML